MKKKDIEILQHKAHAHQQTVAKEAAETREMQSTIAALTAQRDRTIAARDDLAAQIAATQKQIEARLAAQRQRRQQLSRQARHNLPELDFWVTRLCLRIDKGSSGGGDVDRLKFIYDHVDEKNWAREVWFELDMSARDYRVVACRPRLDGAKVDAVVAKLNETRELVVLLKGMRELFVEAVKA